MLRWTSIMCSKGIPVSRAAAINFLKAVRADERLQAEISAAATAKGEVALDAVLDLAASWGLEVTREDWRALQDGADGTDADLSEADLELVAGGSGGAGVWRFDGAAHLALPDGTTLVVAW